MFCAKKLYTPWCGVCVALQLSMEANVLSYFCLLLTPFSCTGLPPVGKYYWMHCDVTNKSCKQKKHLQFTDAWKLMMKLSDLQPVFFRSKNRKAWLVPACLSTRQETMQVIQKWRHTIRRRRGYYYFFFFFFYWGVIDFVLLAPSTKGMGAWKSRGRGKEQGGKNAQIFLASFWIVYNKM